MSEYSVTILTDATSSYIVDADSPAEAAEKAGQLHWEASPSLCHQCSNEIELGDAVGAIVCFDGKEVLDTTWAGESVAKLAAGSAALHAEAEALRAENAKLRTALAKQGERQEAVVYAVHAKGAQVDHHCPLVSPDMAADYLPGCATPLYTTPQPAPSQDVAGLASSDPVAKAEFETRLRKEFESRWPKPKGVTWGAGINDYCVSEFAEGIALSYPDMWMAYKAGAMRTNQ